MILASASATSFQANGLRTPIALGLVGVSIQRDVEGHQVGQNKIRLASGEAFQPAHDTYEPMAVTGPPASAEGACGPEDLESGSDYVFGPPVVAPAGESSSKITFLVSWKTDAPPGFRDCQMVVTRGDGSEFLHSFSLYLGKPQ